MKSRDAKISSKQMKDYNYYQSPTIDDRGDPHSNIHL